MLLHALHTDCVGSPLITQEILQCIQQLVQSAGANQDGLIQSISSDVGPELSAKLASCLGHTASTGGTFLSSPGVGSAVSRSGIHASSPYATAPIHDVLLRR